MANIFDNPWTNPYYLRNRPYVMGGELINSPFAAPDRPPGPSAGSFPPVTITPNAQPQQNFPTAIGPEPATPGAQQGRYVPFMGLNERLDSIIGQNPFYPLANDIATAIFNIRQAVSPINGGTPQATIQQPQNSLVVPPAGQERVLSPQPQDTPQPRGQAPVPQATAQTAQLPAGTQARQANPTVPQMQPILPTPLDSGTSQGAFNPAMLGYILSSIGGLMAGDNPQLQQAAAMGQLISQGAQYAEVARALAGGGQLTDQNLGPLQPQQVQALQQQELQQRQQLLAEQLGFSNLWREVSMDPYRMAAILSGISAEQAGSFANTGQGSIFNTRSGEVQNLPQPPQWWQDYVGTRYSGMNGANPFGLLSNETNAADFAKFLAVSSELDRANQITDPKEREKTLSDLNYRYTQDITNPGFTTAYSIANNPLSTQMYLMLTGMGGLLQQPTQGAGTTDPLSGL